MRALVLVSFLLLLFVPAFSKENPVIVGQKTLRIPQGGSLTISLNDLTVRDEDGKAYPNYPSGFELEVFNGQNYSVKQFTVTPNPNFVGTLTVPVRVTYNKKKSDKYDLRIEVYAQQQETPKNVPPTIIGQVTLKTDEAKGLNIKLSDLYVNDPDDPYPGNFTLKVGTGPNYTVNGTTVIPASGFSGTLSVPVRVNDGEDDSPPFNLQITVTPKANNAAPVITGQTSLSTVRNQPLTITLRNLIVTDPDNKYPDDFTLQIREGANYTINGNQITPAGDFTGSLAVNVSVSDGVNTSNVFSLRVDVIAVEELQITGQNLIEIEEDNSYEIVLADLLVNDPEKRYPSGFSLRVGEGENYTAEGAVITPAKDFSGSLEIPVWVNNGSRESKPFMMVIEVRPVNDPPLLENISEGPVAYRLGSGAIRVAAQAVITDPDDETLNFGEIGFEAGFFQSDADVLVPTYTSSLIRSVFDPVNGILFLIGEAPLAEYQQVLRSITYEFASDSIAPVDSKSIYFLLSDGQDESEIRKFRIEFGGSVDLDIPTVFTPNDDSANDTWRVRARTGGEFSAGQLSIRVFNKRGYLVYESYTLDEEWDGKLDGKVLPADTYFYIIELNASFSKKNFKGVVTLLH